MSSRNPGMSLDLGWINSIDIDLPGVNRRAATIGTRRTVKKQWQAAWLLRAVTCIDLTTLSGDDTECNVERLCFKATHPVRPDLIKALNVEELHIRTGAVCVYPARVSDAVAALKKTGESDFRVASVATGFPSGQYNLETRIKEIEIAVKDGASEIDIVINRNLALRHQWEDLYEEIRAMRTACGDARMKTILAVGDLGSFNNVYKCSLVAMMAGADFIKTSTGKEGINATLPVGIIMSRAIREYYQKTGAKVGFKPAGGIRTAKDALTWLFLVKEELGDDWMKNDLFRFGASALLSDIERQLFHYVYGRYAAGHELAMA